MSMTTTIQTAFGKRRVVRVIGEYVQTIPTPSAPNGEWWTLNPQRGYVPVPPNARGLLAACKSAT
jgi:hypothetical protein